MRVLDASALVDVLLDQPSSGWVLDQMVGQELCAPAHQPVEVVSALLRLHRADVLDRAAVDAAVDEMLALEQTHVLPTAGHIRRAVQLVDLVGVPDGLYVALPEERRCPLITTDRRLGRSEPPCELLLPD